MIRSPVVYSGSKFSLLEHLLPLFPKNIDTLYDVFCGSCTVSLNVQAKNYVLNDSLTPLIDMYKKLKEMKADEVFSRIEDIFSKYNIGNNESKENYIALRSDYNRTKDPLMLLVLSFISFSHGIRFNKKFEFNMPIGCMKNKDHYLKEKKIQLNNFVTKAKTFNFNNCDFHNFLSSLTTRENDFIYLDPPYLITDASYNAGWTEKEELKLLDFCSKTSSKFGISNVFEHKGRSNDLLKEFAKDYNVYYLNKSFGGWLGLRKSNNDKTSEVYICNYDIPENSNL